MGMYYEGGAVIAHKAALLLRVGGRGGREHPPLPYIQSNACRFLFLLLSYLRFAEAASFDKKKSYAGAVQYRLCAIFVFLHLLYRQPHILRLWLIFGAGEGGSLKILSTILTCVTF